MKLFPIVVCMSFILSALFFTGTNGMAGDDEINCIKCHRRATPGHVTDWETSTHADYAYWYGWAMMAKDIGEIQELAHLLRKTHEGKK